MIANSHLTAIARKSLPVPTRWLIKQNLIVHPVLDFGCGKCNFVNPSDWWNYDPYYLPFDLSKWNGSFRTVICNYVLCTLPVKERLGVLREIKSLLIPESSSRAYISVRNDKPNNGWGYSKRNTYQGRCQTIPLECIREIASYRTYVLTFDTKLK